MSAWIRLRCYLLACVVPMLMTIGTPKTGLAELVLRLDAMDAGSITLSSDMTTGTIFGFPDARQVGLKYVEGWGQSFGATANPDINPIFVPLRTSTFNPNLHRPTFDPNGLGSGKPSVNFDFLAGDAVLGAGQRLVAGLDNPIDSDQYTIFFVGQRLDNRFQSAFGQDYNFRPSGWDVGIDGAGNWEGRSGGYDTVDSAAAVSPAGTSEGPGVHSIIATAAGTLDHEARDMLGDLLVNSQPRDDYGIYSGGDFVLGNRGGWDTANSNPFNGRIGEIAIFNVELSASERDAVRAFLENKWVGGPAPTTQQLATAQTLLQQAPPAGPDQLVRYEFRRNLPADDIQTILEPDGVLAGVTASNINSGGGLSPPVPTPGAFASSVVGISSHSAYLGGSWSNNQTEQSPGGGSGGDFNSDGLVDAADYVVWRDSDGTPANYDLWRANFGNAAGGSDSPYYLGFTVSPDAGKEIAPATLSFTISRGELDTSDLAKSLRSAENGVDSFGVWIDAGNGFEKVGGQVHLGPPEGSSELVAYFFDTVTIDLSSVGPFTEATEIRIYFWHDGPFNSPPIDGDSHNARIDNVRLYGTVQAAGAAATLDGLAVPEGSAFGLLLWGGSLALVSRRASRRLTP